MIVIVIMANQALEQEVNGLLQEWKDSIINRHVRSEQDRSGQRFFSRLHDIPPQYKSLALLIQMDEDENAQIEASQIEEKFGVQSKSGDRFVYDIIVLVPRLPVLKDVVGHHGSRHRDVYLAQGEIKTVEHANMRDRKTDSIEAIEVNPTRIGAFSLDRRLGMYKFFPRNILQVGLIRDLPTYLTQDEIGLVTRFYDRLLS